MFKHIKTDYCVIIIVIIIIIIIIVVILVHPATAIDLEHHYYV